MSNTHLRTSSADGEQYLEIRTANGLSQYWRNSSDEPVEPQAVPSHFTPLGAIDETEGKQWPPWAGGPDVERRGSSYMDSLMNGGRWYARDLSPRWDPEIAEKLLSGRRTVVHNGRRYLVPSWAAARYTDDELKEFML